jgi:hypothetical protein
MAREVEEFAHTAMRQIHIVDTFIEPSRRVMEMPGLRLTRQQVEDGTPLIAEERSVSAVPSAA